MSEDGLTPAATPASLTERLQSTARSLEAEDDARAAEDEAALQAKLRASARDVELEPDVEGGPLEEGQRVEARHGGNEKWYPGVISAVNKNPRGRGASYDIHYNDGDKETGVQRGLIRLPPPNLKETEELQHEGAAKTVRREPEPEPEPEPRAEPEEEEEEPLRLGRLDAEEEEKEEEEGGGRRHRRRKPSPPKKKPRRPLKSYPDGCDKQESVLKLCQRPTPPRKITDLVRDSGFEPLFETDQHKWTCLHWAVSEGYGRLVSALLDLIQDAERYQDDDALDTTDAADRDILNARDWHGWTPLHLAAIGGSDKQFEIAKHLVRARAKLSIQDDLGDRPVDCISARGRAKQAWRTLLKHGDTNVDLHY